MSNRKSSIPACRGSTMLVALGGGTDSSLISSGAEGLARDDGFDGFDVLAGAEL